MEEQLKSKILGHRITQDCTLHAPSVTEVTGEGQSIRVTSRGPANVLAVSSIPMWFEPVALDKRKFIRYIKNF